MSVESLASTERLYDSEGISLYIPTPLEGRHISESFNWSRPPRRLRSGSLADLRIVGDPNIPEWYRGPHDLRLDEFVKLVWGPNNTSVYIVDHHQFALYGWCEGMKEGKINSGATLWHFDDHSDAFDGHLGVMTKEIFKNGTWSLSEIVEYTQELGCWEFIEPAQRMGLVGQLIHIAPWGDPKSVTRPAQFGQTNYTEMDMDYYRNRYMPGTDRQRGKIVDIDLDYFVAKGFKPENEEADIQTMRDAIVSAGVATLATSPGFIGQHKAINIIKRILE